MEQRHLPRSRNVEDRRDEEGRVDPLERLPWAFPPQQALEEAQPYPSGPLSRALGIGNIGSRPYTPSLYEMMQGQDRSIPLPQVSGAPSWLTTRAR